VLLKALIGPYAGQVRDYAPQAVAGALLSGAAQHVSTIDEYHEHSGRELVDAIDLGQKDRTKRREIRKK
jgi:phage terminase large subunit-like protein